MMANRVKLATLVAAAAGTLSAGLAHAQSPGAPALWTGHVSCQVDVHGDGYAHQETQTWTLTGGSPSSGGIPTYPAIWSATGHGTARQVVGAPPGAVSWKTNVAPMSSAIAIFVRASDSRLVFLPRTRLTAPAGHSGTRQLSSGTTQNVQYPAYEWPLPVIADAPTSAHTVGSGTVVVSGGLLPAHAVSGTAAANCTWEFSRSDSGSAARPDPAHSDAATTRPGMPIPVGAATPAPSKNPAAPATPSAAQPSADAALLQVSPSSAMRGQQKISVTITGRSTHFDQKATKVMVGAGLFVSVDSVTVSSPTSLVANLNIAKTSGMRPRKGTISFLVTVTTGPETVQLFDGFRVSSPHMRRAESK